MFLVDNYFSIAARFFRGIRLIFYVTKIFIQTKLFGSHDTNSQQILYRDKMTVIRPFTNKKQTNYFTWYEIGF